MSSPALLQVAEDTPLNATITATDPDGDSLTFTVTSPAAHGTASVTSAGALSYAPAANYNGADAFGVSVADGRGGVNAATLNVTVTPVNDAPVITNASVTFAEDTESTQKVVITDVEGDAVEFTDVTQPAHAASFNADSDGGVRYLSESNFNGTDTFTARVTDAHGAVSADTVITIHVTPVNDPPMATDDALVATTSSSPLNVLANDVDVDGEALTVTIDTPPAIGTASVVNNQILFQPPAGYAGPASLVYKVTDAAGTSSTANLRLIADRFQSLLFIEGGTRTQLYKYDGFAITSLNPNSQYQTFNFDISFDGNRAVYNERSSQSDRGSLYVHDFAQPGSRTFLGVRDEAGLRYSLNHDGSYLLYSLTLQPPPVNRIYTRLIKLPNITVGNVFPEQGNNVFPNDGGVFNPVTDEFYFTGRLSQAATPSPNVSAFDTVFAGSIAEPSATQISGNYPVDNGSGSGIGLRVTSDGKQLVYAATNFTTGIASLLVNDRTSNTETDLYRPFSAGEFPVPLDFDMNATGSKVCFRVNNPGASSVGPGRVWVASPAAPGSATAVTPLADYNFTCHFAADGKSIAYFSSNAGQQAEVWWVDSSLPNVVRRLREPLGAGESTDFFLLARNSMTAVVGINPGGGAPVNVYRVDLDSPGSSVRIGSPGATGAGPDYRLSDDGNWLAYLKDETPAGGGLPVKRLHIMSTRLADFDMALGGGGVSSYALRPQP